MPVDAGTSSPPVRDNRWKLVESTMRRHGHRAHALIEVLHSAQESYGFLDPPVLAQLARDLGYSALVDTLTMVSRAARAAGAAATRRA
jgi:NADH:ubiquinone oxidoreductase subunit E